MTMLKKLLRDGRALGLAALVAVACSPAAAAVLPTVEDRFVDEHVAAVASQDLDAATGADVATGPDAAALALTSRAEDSQATSSEQAPAAEPVATPRDAVLPPTAGDTTTTTNTTTTVSDSAPAVTLAAISHLSVSTTAATLTVETAPHVTCAITVSGAGRVPGLDAKQSDASGHIVWTWAVAGTITGAARVECTTSSQSIVLTPKLERADSDQHDLQTQGGDHTPAQVPAFAKESEHRGAAPHR